MTRADYEAIILQQAKQKAESIGLNYFHLSEKEKLQYQLEVALQLLELK